MSKLSHDKSLFRIGIKIIPANYTQDQVDEVFYKNTQKNIMFRIKLSCVISIFTMLVIIPWVLIKTIHNSSNNSIHIQLLNIIICIQMISCSLIPILVWLYIYQKNLFKNKKEIIHILILIESIVVILINIFLMYVFITLGLSNILQQSHQNSDIIIFSFIVLLVVFICLLVILIYGIYKFIRFLINYFI